MVPGIYEIDEVAYHSDPCEVASLSASIAKVMLNQSPRHAWIAHPKLNPNYQPEESSRFDLGSIAHQLFLEGSDAKICVVEADDWRTKVAKEQRDQARESGLLPILKKQEYHVRKMADAAHAFLAGSELKDVMSDGKAEQSLAWQENNGIWCRSRLDWLTNDRNIILDLKTTDNAEPDTWGRRMVNMDYHLQAAFYMRGVQFLTGASPTFVFLVQELEAPYACSLVGLSNSMIEIAHARVDRAIDQWKFCLERNEWPGYPNQICYIEPSSYVLNQHIMNQED